MKKFLIISVLFISLFVVAGCGNKNEKESNVLSYDKPENVKSEKKENGKLDDSKDKWDSVTYTFDGMTITVKHYENSSIDGFFDKSYEDKTIKGINYKYKETKIDNEFLYGEYATQVDDDVYFFLCTFKDNDNNRKTINSLLESVVVKKK